MRRAYPTGGLVLPLLLALVVACSGPPGSPDDADGTGDDAGTNTSDAGVEAVEFIDMRIEELTATRAVARFDTSRPTTCVVEYGTDPASLTESATDPNMEEGELSVDHEVPLEDLEPETAYYWRGVVVDEDDREHFSEVLEFTTPATDDELPPLSNFSEEATVTVVSSNFGGGDNDSTWGANNAFDGQMSTEWATAGDGDDAMVEIDFGRLRKVTHFAFRSRKMADGTSIVEAVQVRFDGGGPVGPFDTPDPDERYVFELEVPAAAETARVEAVETTGGNTGAREIEFLGTPKE